MILVANDNFVFYSSLYQRSDLYKISLLKRYIYFW